MTLLQLRTTYLPRFAFHIERLACHHAIRCGSRARKLRDQSDTRFTLQRNIFGDCLERECLQRITRQDCGCFVETHVTGWSAASQIVIVHRRKIVVNQRVSMNHFKRARRPYQRFDRRAERLTHGEQERRPETLSARKNAPTYRLVNLLRRGPR